MRTILALIAAALIAVEQSSPTPDIVIVNARVFTGDHAAPWAEAVSVSGVFTARIGPERLARSTQVKAIVQAGVPFAIGSDGPMNPFLNIMFATINANNPSQALTVEQALRAYTAGSAAAAFAERDKGMLKSGMLADMALLSQDIFKVPPPELPRTVSILTIVNGKVVHPITGTPHSQNSRPASPRRSRLASSS